VSIPQSFIQELVARADVVDIVGRYVQLKKAGANFSGLCPFHAEKSPSFTVSPSKQFYHCFGCGKNGNAIGFLMDHAGMNFVEAVKDLAQQYGMQVPEDDASPQERERAAEQRQKQNTLSDVLEKAGEAYRKQLKESPNAIDYFKGRGLSGDIARQFGLGYAPQGWRSLASVFPNYEDPLLVESGLVIQSQDEDGAEDKRYDRFRDRVMFPIRNVKGECIGFGGRVLGNDKPKYLNSPETPVFSKGRELYGLFEARAALREQGYVLVTEALDGALPYATDVRSVKFLFLPAEHDPDSYIRAFGKEGFARCISEAVPLSRFLIDSAREGCDLNTAEGRARLASNARPLWTQMPDGALKRQLLSEIATLVQLASRELTDLWLPQTRRGGEAAGRFAKGHAKGGSDTRRAGGYGQRSGADSAGHTPGRIAPASRADHAARMFLGQMAQWDAFSAEDHAMLCELPAPHGPLFIWLERQLHEHGPQPWGAMREGLRGHDSEPLALRLMGAHEMAGSDAHEDALQELRNLLRRMLVEHIKTQVTAAIDASRSDPTALQRYRELQARRRELEAASPTQA
jgi:DNA primase